MPRRFYQQRGRGGTLSLLCVSTSPDLLPKDARRKSTFVLARNRKKQHTHTQKTCNFFSVIFSHHFFHPKTGAKSQLRKVGNQSSNFPRLSKLSELEGQKLHHGLSWRRGGFHRDDTGNKFYVPWKKKFTFPGKNIYSPWKRNLGSSGPVVLWLFGPLVLWSCGPVVLWSCGPLVPLVLWSSGPVVLWSCGRVVLWSSWSQNFYELRANHVACFANASGGEALRPPQPPSSQVQVDVLKFLFPGY